MKTLPPYDKTIKVGDIVTGYYKGYWRVTVIVERPRESLNGTIYTPAPLIHGELVLDSNGKKAKKRRESWDISYSRKVDRAMVEKIITNDQEAFETKKNNLLELLK